MLPKAGQAGDAAHFLVGSPALHILETHACSAKPSRLTSLQLVLRASRVSLSFCMVALHAAPRALQAE